MNVAIGRAVGGRVGTRPLPVRPSRRWLIVAAKVAVVTGLCVATFAAVRATGGSPSPLNHLGYLPVVGGGYFFGWRGGLLVGAIVAFTLGPLPALVQLPGGIETLDAWAIRGVFFMGIGWLGGYLFDRRRSAVDGWRSASVMVTSREREAIRALGRGAEMKDIDTGEHVGRVQVLSESLALRVGIGPTRAADIGWSAMLHDVGKLHIPDRILLRPRPLSAAEWQIMRQHPIWGEEILAHGDGFELARRIARWHHENFDGSGYPDGLVGDQIPLEARIVRITDAFDAMTHRRPYHPGRSVEWAMEELERCRGRQFDPAIVAIFIQLLAEPIGTSRV